MKKNKIFLLVLPLALFIGLYLISRGPGDDSKGFVSVAAAKEVTLYKTPSCGCCRVYASYLEKEGFKVNSVDLNDLSAIKSEYHISNDMESCHTTVIEGYAVEGHIPVDAINKLLTEKPDIWGIAMPGMPVGSPGMPGRKTGGFTIHSLMPDGSHPMFMEL